MRKLALGALLATGLAYALRRRNAGVEWVADTAGSVAGAARGAAGRVTGAAGGTDGAALGTDPIGDRPDDVTLARKVESEIFRSDDVPKGQINVNAELGVVYLRGEVPEQSLIDDLVARAREVDGVTRVESLLHLPGQEAPMKED
jgi:osmotically-inducible protein OsmY